MVLSNKDMETLRTTAIDNNRHAELKSLRP